MLADLMGDVPMRIVDNLLAHIQMEGKKTLSRRWSWNIKPHYGTSEHTHTGAGVQETEYTNT